MKGFDVKNLTTGRRRVRLSVDEVGTTMGRSAAGTSLKLLSETLPPVVYYLRNREDLIKIGWTANLAQRRHWHGVPWSNILAITPGTLRDERTIHFRFARYVARGVEYYYPVAPMFDHIDRVRAAVGLSPMVRWTRSGPIAPHDPRRYVASR